MKNADRSLEIRAELLLLLLVIIWGSNYPLAKFAIAELNVFVFNAIRFLVASGVLVIVLRRHGEWKPIPRSDWGEILRAGLAANVLYQSAFIVGLSMTTASNSAVIMATSPLWTILIHARLHREKIHTVTFAGIVLSLLGVIMIIGGSGKKLEFGGHEIIGDMVCLAAAVLLAFSTNLQKPLLIRYSPLHLATVMIAIGTVGITIVATPFAVQTDFPAIGWEYWLATGLSGVLSIGVANVIWSYGVRHIGPHRTSVFSNLIPIVAFVLSYLTLREQINTLQIAGTGLTIGGVWLARR